MVQKKSGRLDYRLRKKILADYFAGEKKFAIAQKYGCTNDVINKFLDGRATKNYTDTSGKSWRRCSVCEIYKPVEEYGKHWQKKGKTILKPNCNTCQRLRTRNKKIVKKNMDAHYDMIYWARLSWWKNGWRYKTRRKIFYILGEINGRGKKTGVIEQQKTIFRKRILLEAGYRDTSGRLNLQKKLR